MNSIFSHVLKAISPADNGLYLPRGMVSVENNNNPEDCIRERELYAKLPDVSHFDMIV